MDRLWEAELDVAIACQDSNGENLIGKIRGFTFHRKLIEGVNEVQDWIDEANENHEQTQSAATGQP